jgi:hypothetical protein
MLINSELDVRSRFAARRRVRLRMERVWRKLSSAPAPHPFRRFASVHGDSLEVTCAERAGTASAEPRARSQRPHAGMTWVEREIRVPGRTTMMNAAGCDHASGGLAQSMEARRTKTLIVSTLS